jgi:hypothetical protein
MNINCEGDAIHEIDIMVGVSQQNQPNAIQSEQLAKDA